MIDARPVERRSFLLGGLAAAAGGVVAAGAAPWKAVLPLAGARRTFPTLAMLTKNEFETCLGGTFRLELGSGNLVEIQLIEVTGYPARTMRHGAAREPFSILFRGPANLQVEQRIFKVSHSELGTHEIFLVPLGPDEAGMRLEAVFG